MEISFSETAEILKLEIGASTFGTSKLKDTKHPTFGETLGHLELQKEVITFENLKHVQNYILAVSKIKISGHFFRNGMYFGKKSF